MRIDEIKIPPKLQEWLTEFRTSPYFKYARKTFEAERQRKTLDQLHEQYEHSLLNNRLGKVWMQLYSHPDFAMEEILNVPANPPYDAMDRRDFCCNLSMIMEVESQNTTEDGKVTTETFPRKAVLDYVGKIKQFVTPEWADKVDGLWEKLLDEQKVIDFIKATRRKDIFNHYTVHRIIAVLISRGVYTGSNMELSRALEGGDNNYRTRMGDGVGEIEDIIKKYVTSVNKKGSIVG